MGYAPECVEGVSCELRIAPVLYGRRSEEGVQREDPGGVPFGERQGTCGRSPSECKPRAFASSGERARAISDAPSHSSQRIETSAPPSECARTSSLGTGSDPPQSGP